MKQNQLAVIIPTYNAHKTIKRTLASLVNQLDVNYHIYLSVDGEPKGTYDYLLEDFNTLPMTILYSPTNKGPGQARQYGIDNTTEPFITFIDTDDIFTSATSLSILFSNIEDQDIMVSTPHWQEYDSEEENKTIFQPVTYSMLTWLHGKIYRRSHLDKYNIRFTDHPQWSRSNEDVGFNTMVIMFSNTEDKRIKQLTDRTVYLRFIEPTSITRENNKEFGKTKSLPGWAYNKSYAIKHYIKVNGFADIDTEKEIAQLLPNLYLTFYRTDYGEDYLEVLSEETKKIYRDLYKYVSLSKKDIHNINLKMFNNNKTQNRKYMKWIKQIIKEVENE